MICRRCNNRFESPAVEMGLPISIHPLERYCPRCYQRMARLVGNAEGLLSAAIAVLNRADEISECRPEDYGRLIADAIIDLSDAVEKAGGLES